MPKGFYQRKPKKPLAERFWPRVFKNGADGCWLWQGYHCRFGYGYFSIDRVPTTAHRVAYLLTYGSFDQSLNVLHRCDNPPCVNPTHLFLGTRADNVRDMDAKGRRGRGAPRGEESPFARLTDENVRRIRAMYATGSYAQRELGEMFGVARSTIFLAVSHKNWRHVA